MNEKDSENKKIILFVNKYLHPSKKLCELCECPLAAIRRIDGHKCKILL